MVDRYLPRIVDAELDDLCPTAPAISIEGPRGVGKTQTALRRAATAHRLDSPTELNILQADPARVISGDPPVLIDEWQRMPASWDLVRRAVDEDPENARFLLTGSAAPADAPTHPGAGRIVTVRMRPLSLAERGLSTPMVRLADLLTGERGHIHGSTAATVGVYAEEITRSGFPGLRHLSGRTLRSHLDGYIDRIVDHDVDDLGRVVRNRGMLRRWMTAYAAATSTAASFEKIRDAASAGESDKPAKTTTIPYRDALEGLWMIEEIPAWLPTRNHLRRLAAAPKHQMADPAIAARLLGVDADALLDGSDAGWDMPRDGTLLGALFESLVAMSVRVYAQACEARVGHLRTHAGEHGVDLVVARADGRFVAIEVKLSATVNDNDVAHLRWLAERTGPDLLDAAVIHTGPGAYRRADGIAVVPAALLTA